MGCKGVFVTRTCYHDGLSLTKNLFAWKLQINLSHATDNIREPGWNCLGCKEIALSENKLTVCYGDGFNILKEGFFFSNDKVNTINVRLDLNCRCCCLVVLVEALRPSQQCFSHVGKARETEV